MSLAVARMITPLMAAYFLKSKGIAEHGEGPAISAYMRVLAWTLDKGKMLSRRAGLTGPRRRVFYVLSLVLTVIVLLAVPALAMFEFANGSVSGAWKGLIGLDVHKQIATAVSSDTNAAVHKIVAKVFEVVIVLLVSALSFLAAFAVFKAIEAPAGGDSAFARNQRWLTARFYDHRIWMLGIGWFSLLVTIMLFGLIPGQFQPTIDDENSRVEIEMVPGTTLADTKRVVNAIADELRKEPEVERLLERIRAAMGDPQFAHLSVFNSTPLERTLAVRLGIRQPGQETCFYVCPQIRHFCYPQYCAAPGAEYCLRVSVS
jgi:multidrug efflux pump subunit AcrB